MPVITNSSQAITTSVNTRIKVPLFEHQKRVLYHALELEANSYITLAEGIHLQSNLGVLSCPPGAGKSIVALSLAMTARTSSSSNTVVLKPQSMLTSGSVVSKTLVWLDCSMIVVPKMLVGQWSDYIGRFADIPLEKWKVVQTANDVGLVLSDPSIYEIIIVSADQYNEFPEHMHFKRVFFDEVDTINIPSCQRINTDRIWCLSSNSDRFRSARLQNRGFLKDMFSEFYRIAEMYGNTVWDKICIYTDPIYLQHVTSLNHTTMYLVCKPLVPEILTLESNALTRMLEAGLEREIVNSLGIIYVEDKIKAYLTLTASIQEEMFALSKDNISQDPNAQARVMKDMEAIRERILFAQSCPISYDTIKYPCITPCCKNVFDATNIIPWVYNNQTCAICRQHILTPQLLFCKTNLHPLMHKFETMVKWVDNVLQDDSARVLICCRNATLRQVRHYLDGFLSYTCFRGKTVRRPMALFEAGNPNVLLLDVDQYSTGLNLTVATHLLIMDKLQDSLRTQVIGRALRIGRTCPLQIFQIEEKELKD